jgi:hypothetical protein
MGRIKPFDTRTKQDMELKSLLRGVSSVKIDEGSSTLGQEGIVGRLHELGGGSFRQPLI